MPRIRVPAFDGPRRRVTAALAAGHLVAGPHLEELSADLQSRFGFRHVSLTVNGFSALFAVLRASLPSGSTVRAPAVGTCFAISHAIRAAGHTESFADLEPRTWSIEVGDDPEAHAVVPDHFGVLAEALRRPVQGRGLLIEDAAQAFLGRERRATRARVLALSFYPTKIANGIDGGAVLTDDPDLHARVERLLSYHDQFAWDETVRFNLGMPNLHAAHLLGTLEHLPAVIDALGPRFVRLAEAARAASLEPFGTADDLPSRLVVRAGSPIERDRAVEELLTYGVEAAGEFIALCPPGHVTDFPVGASLCATTFSIPFHPGMTDRDVDHVEDALGRLRWS